MAARAATKAADARRRLESNTSYVPGSGLFSNHPGVGDL